MIDMLASPQSVVNVIGALAIVTLAWPGLRHLSAIGSPSAERPRDSITAIALGIAAVACATASAFLAWNRTRAESAWDIAAWWLAGIGVLVLASLWGARPGQALQATRIQARTWPWATIAAAAFIVIAAAAARFLSLERFPTVIDGDEGYYLAAAREARDGTLRNPFQEHFWLIPADMWTAWEGWVSRPFEDAIASYRLVSAFVGTLSVVATFLVARRLLGTPIGLASAAILAFMPLHLWASRSALNNIFDAFVLAFALWFLDRAICLRSRQSAIWCGLILGLGFYGYYGARLYPGFAALCLLVALVAPHLRLPFNQAIRLGLWMLAGMFTGAAPLFAYFAANPDVFMSRFRTVTQTGSTEQLSLINRLERVAEGLLYPFHTQLAGFAGGFYRQGPPFLEWTLVPFVAIGGIAWIVWVLQRFRDPDPGMVRPEFLLIAWIVIVAPISQTDPMQSQRFLAMTPIWAMAAGTGLVVAGMAFTSIIRVPATGLRVALAVALIGITLVHIQQFYDEDQQLVAYGDSHTTRGYDLGWRIHRTNDDVAFLMAGYPYINYGGSGNWLFQSPGLDSRITEFGPFAEPPGGVPVIAENEVLILAGDRSAEACEVIERNPNASVGAVHDRYGNLLYTVFSPVPDLALPVGSTPAETTLSPVELSSFPC